MPTCKTSAHGATASRTSIQGPPCNRLIPAEIVGIAVGASIGVILLVIILAAFIVYALLRRNKDDKQSRIQRMKDAKNKEVNQLTQPAGPLQGGRPSNLSSVPGRSMEVYGIQVGYLAWCSGSVICMSWYSDAGMCQRAMQVHDGHHGHRQHQCHHHHHNYNHSDSQSHHYPMYLSRDCHDDDAHMSHSVAGLRI